MGKYMFYNFIIRDKYWKTTSTQSGVSNLFSL